ncbi:MAG TPA: hypothetical protein VMM60_13255 [Ilumatobacter sp.]|nr:hypothetical protein [Ilumatobacter sp.]
MKRVTWFVGGVAAGVTGASYAKKKVSRTVHRTAETLSPKNIAKSASTKARAKANVVVDAVREGRAAGKAREHELRTRRDHVAEPIDGRLGPDDQLLVDGQPVDTGRVIVLKKK